LFRNGGTDTFRNDGVSFLNGAVMDADKIYARRWWTLGVLCLSLLVIGLDNTILNVALPTLVRDLRATQSQLQWIVDAYTIVYASLLLTTGSMGDKFGRKGALSVGLAVFGLGSVASAFSGSAAMLIAARGVAGIGGCIIMPATLSILTNVFPAGERGKAIGVWAGVSGLGIVIGPTVGGWLLQHFWWGSVFLINVPVVIAALIAGYFLVPTSRDPSSPRLDPVGTVLSAVGLVGVLYAIIEGPSKGWTNTGVLAAFAFGVALVATFIRWELRSDHPMLDVRFFQNPRFSGASIAVTLIFFAMFGSLFFLTQYLQDVLGYSALQAGLGFAPLAATLMISAPNSSRLTARFGTKVVVTAGMAVTAGALLLLTQATVHSGYLLVGTVLALLGAGMGTAMAPATDSIMGSLPLAKAGVGSAVNDTTRQIGGALGVAILGSITNSVYRSHVGSSAVIAALPAAARAAVRNGIGNAVAVAQQMGANPTATAVANQAKKAFVHAMTSTVYLGAAFALAGAAFAFWWLPARPAVEPGASRADEADGGGAPPALPIGSVPVAR
jgi:EmrB/QacA subfamily drug resistance transporter